MGLMARRAGRRDGATAGRRGRKMGPMARRAGAKGLGLGLGGMARRAGGAEIVGWDLGAVIEAERRLFERKTGKIFGRTKGHVLLVVMGERERRDGSDPLPYDSRESKRTARRHSYSSGGYGGSSELPISDSYGGYGSSQVHDRVGGGGSVCGVYGSGYSSGRTSSSGLLPIFDEAQPTAPNQKTTDEPQFDKLMAQPHLEASLVNEDQFYVETPIKLNFAVACNTNCPSSNCSQ
ncbi:hypothetical protein CDL15_Pgr004528 [Punica granatum]|uniref:Uncharacterized protein n=1 Tax=Punica granatum TaxID=22663 RepID=A0A218WRB7_PUNGR|nr:hypothetical protein CDL15_Pgr004528 [Punica granatum]